MPITPKHVDVGNVLTKAEWLSPATHEPITAAMIWAVLTNFAGMYRHESVDNTVIQEVNDWHLVNDFTEGESGGGWAFHAGGQLALTAQANNGDGKTLITCAGHGLADGDVISISGSTSYDGVWVVEQVTPPDTFVINTGWVADEGAKTAEHGSHFIAATVGAAGKYLVTYSMSIRPLSPNCVVEVSSFHNASQCIKCESQTYLGVGTDYQNVAGQSLQEVLVGDVVSLALRNLVDGGDFLIRNGNMTVVRVG